MHVELRFTLEPELAAAARKKVGRMIHGCMHFQCTCCWEDIVTKITSVVTGLCPSRCRADTAAFAVLMDTLHMMIKLVTRLETVLTVSTGQNHLNICDGRVTAGANIC